MAGASKVKAGQAYVELATRDRALIRGLNAAQSRLRAFAKSANQIGDTMLRVGRQMATVGAALSAPFAIAIKSASDMEEATSKFNALFGDMADEATAAMQKIVDEVGRSKLSIMDAMGAYQAFFVGLGFGAREAAAVSEQLTRLALDFASFHNLSDDEAIGRFISALSGSGEVLDRFGINIKEAALNQKLLEQGIKGGSRAATEGQKAMARLAIIMEAMGDQGAIGDAVRTSGSFSNQMKRLGGIVQDVSAAVGEALLPYVTRLVNELTKVAKAVAAWISANSRVILIAAAVTVGVTAIGAALLSVGVAFKVVAVAASGLAATLGMVKIAIAAIVSPIGIALAAVAGLAAAFLLYTETGGKALDWLKGKFGEIASFAKESFGGISDALEAGDIALAAKVLWASLRVAFERGVLELKKIWEGFKTFITKTAVGAFYGVQSAWEITQNALSNAWLETSAFLGRTWTRFTSLLKSTWERTQSWLEDRWHDLFSLFDETYDADAAKALNSRLSRQAIAEIDAEKQRLLDENNRILGEQRKESARQHEQNMAQIGKDANDAMAAVDAAGATAISEAQKQFEEARREWKKAREDAAKARAEFGQDKGPESSEAPGAPDQQRFADLIKSMMAGAGAMQQAASVRGTFSAFEAMGLGAQSTAEKIAKATEETAKNTRKISLNLNGIPTLTFN